MRVITIAALPALFFLAGCGETARQGPSPILVPETIAPPSYVMGELPFLAGPVIREDATDGLPVIGRVSSVSTDMDTVVIDLPANAEISEGDRFDLLVQYDPAEDVAGTEEAIGTTRYELFAASATVVELDRGKCVAKIDASTLKEIVQPGAIAVARGF